MNIEAGKIYWLPDGGEFKAPYNVDEIIKANVQHISLSTHEGRSGVHVARTGIMITPEGRIYHTLWDFETERNERLLCGLYTVDDLVEIEERAEITGVPFEMPPQASAEEFDESPF